MAFNELSPDEAERLALLAEECAEVIQIVGKILRHGMDSCHPTTGVRNRDLLEKELGDVRLVVDLLVARGDVSGPEIIECAKSKALRVIPYLHEQDRETQDWLSSYGEDG